LFQEVDDMATLSNSYHVSCRSGQKLSFTARLQSVQHNANCVAKLQVRISSTITIRTSIIVVFIAITFAVLDCFFFQARLHKIPKIDY